MLSIVIPVYNESVMIPKLLERLVLVINKIEMKTEIIFVDDGSTDKTLELLKEKKQIDSRIKIIELSRNFGHQAALTAGLENSAGDFTAMMDSDLQDPPELLIDMLELLKSGEYDIVNGYREERSEEPSRKLLTKIFHKIFSGTSGLSGIENTGNFSMINRLALDALLSLNEKIRYLPGLRSYIGFRQTKISYTRQERVSGSSKMKLPALFSLAMDALFSFSRFPLRLCLWLGVIGVVFFFLAGIHVLISKFTGWAPFGWSSTLISIYFLGSIQLTFLGVLGEYLYRTYRESQHRPVYFIRNKYF